MQFPVGGGFQSTPGTTYHGGGLVVVLSGRFPRRVDVEHYLLVVFQFQHRSPAYPPFLKHGSLGDGIIHVFLLKRAVAHELFAVAQFLDGVELRPGRIPVAIDGVHLNGLYGRRVNDFLQYGVFGNQVTHHDETPVLASEAAEQGFLYPVGHFPYTGFAPAHLIVVEVVHHDVVRTHLPETQTTGRLATASGEKGALVFGDKFAFLPHAAVVLFAKVPDDVLVVLQFCLKVAQQAVGAVFTLAHQYHDMQLTPEFQPERDADVQVYRLGMTARPLADQTQFRMGGDVACRLVMEFRIRTLAIMRQVALAETVVVFQGTGDIPLAFRFGFHPFLRGHPFHPLAVFLPSFQGFFLFLFRHDQPPFWAKSSFR